MTTVYNTLQGRGLWTLLVISIADRIEACAQPANGLGLSADSVGPAFRLEHAPRTRSAASVDHASMKMSLLTALGHGPGSAADGASA
jgi:hypothetical protein